MWESRRPPLSPYFENCWNNFSLGYYTWQYSLLNERKIFKNMIGSIECFYSICFTLGELLKLAGAYIYIYQYVWALRKCEWHPTPVLLPGKSHGWKSLEGCSPWSRWGSDTTERLHFHFSLSCIGEGNGNPLQCSCLENLRDGGASWAAVYGVTQSRTRLKWLSSSSQP